MARVSLVAGATRVLVELEACREVLGGVVACGWDSTGALGIEASLPESANGVAELLVTATFASDFTGVARALDSVAGLSGDDVKRSSTNAPPITTAVIAPNTTPK